MLSSELATGGKCNFSHPHLLLDTRRQARIYRGVVYSYRHNKSEIKCLAEKTKSDGDDRVLTYQT